MAYVACTIKHLPKNLMTEASETAIRINPHNAPSPLALRALAPTKPPTKMKLAAMVDRYWGAKGVRLTVGFMDKPPADLRARILSHMNAWGAWSNVRFVASSTDPVVRIARTAGDGYWSYLGTDIRHIAATQPTMNLDSFTMNTPESEFYRVVRHETGHTLGFPHEHMRAEVVKRIDAKKAVAFFAATYGWSKQDVIDQVLTPMANSALIATASPDVDSIMCYDLPAEIMKDGVAVPGGVDINTRDAAFVNSIYPWAVAPISVHPHRPSTGRAPGGKAYFFKGSQYVRYDRVADKADSGYPKAIAGNWKGFPSSFASGLDAVAVWGNGKVYFFKGTQYVRFDLVADAVDPGYPKKIADAFPGLGAGSINAAAVWPNGKAYFFLGNQYIRYDVKADKADLGYPKPIAGNWPGFPAAFAAGVDAVAVWPNGKAYFFRGANYLRYDIAADKVDAGYPKPISGNWPGLWSSDLSA